MEFNEKLQELRKKNNLTQEELARSLFVTRTAVSKWESGRGYPSIDSLKAIAQFFSLTLDELLSSDEVLKIAKENQKSTESYFRDLVFGLLDIFSALLFFLPLFANRIDGFAKSVTLLNIDTAVTIKIIYVLIVAFSVITGILTLALQNIQIPFYTKIKTKLSLALGILFVMIFSLGLHPYASVFSLVLLIVKATMLSKRP